MNIFDVKKVHCIGIGGIGVSALAKFFHAKNIVVTGSDESASVITQDLETKYDIPITIGVNPDAITSNVDIVVYSPAIKTDNSEYKRALDLGIKLVSYPEALGQISKNRKTVAIAGTNGKTTTTSMLVEVIKDQEIHPDVVVGGILQKYNSNFLSGDSEYFITEACEYKRSFLNIYHDIAVVTNISEDHLDYFKDLSDIQSAFIEFINNKKNSGNLVCNTQLIELKSIVEQAKKNGLNIIDYSKYLSDEYSVTLPGEHNRQNMATALAVVEALELDIDKAARYLATDFKGAERRMEYIGKTESGALLYDDYAHNPEGIEYLITALRKHYPEKNIITLFEPHLYSRTEDFKEDFGRELSKSDILYLFPVYRAREEHQPEHDFILTNYIHKKDDFFILESYDKFISEFDSYKYNDNHVLVTVGAGDIWKVSHALKKQD